ncbi:MAG: hypothetical protein RLZZ366_923 [Pseudomonadota bacterium]|jgi:aryl-alcohol dehydrogenase-like predicted oxidoreductase
MGRLGSSEIEIAPLVFGGNIPGWPVDRDQSFTFLDSFLDHVLNAIDTADVYVQLADSGVEIS